MMTDCATDRREDPSWRLKTAALYAEAQALGFDNPPWSDASLRLLFLRLSPWQDANRSTPHLFLYALMRSVLGPSAYGDFAFFPSRSDRGLLDAARRPSISATASRREAAEFDALLISCSYALELVNLPLLLLRSGIPLRSSLRRTQLNADGGPRWPLIIMGGSNNLAGQGAVFGDGDSFVDGLYLGEAEDGGAAFFRTLDETRGQAAAERLRLLEERIPAFWAAGCGPPDGPRPDGRRRRVVPGRSAAGGGPEPFLPLKYPLLNSPEASTVRLQIAWGCPSFCSFCFEGWERKPYREVPAERVLAAARELARNTGASTAEVYAFNFNTHADILGLILELNRVFDRVNMMSQRADILQKTPGMLACELAGEKRSFTIGVEGISAAMRAYYAKGLSDADLWPLLGRLIQENVRELKLFFIIAGIEAAADLAEFEVFCVRLRALIDARRGGTRVVFSAGYLVRMPFTPLRAAALALDRKKMRSLAQALEKSAAAAGFEFRVAMDWDEYVADQLLVAGGYGLAEGLEAAARSGAAYDGGIEGNLAGPLIAALRKTGELDPPSPGDDGLRGRLLGEKPPGHVYPLDFVQSGVPGSFLDAAYADALDRRDPSSCLGSDAGDGRCLGCSACADKGERGFLTRHRVAPAPGMALAEKIAALIAEKRRSRPVFVPVVLPAALGGATEAFLSAYLLGRLLSAAPELIGRLFRIEEALWTSPVWRDRIGGGGTGHSVLALYGIGGLTASGDPRLSAADAERTAALLRMILAGAVAGTATGTDMAGGDAAQDGFDPAAAVPGLVIVEFSVPDRETALRRIRSWLAGCSLAFTERRPPETGAAAPETNAGRVFEIAPKDQKKRQLSRVEVSFADAAAEPGKAGSGAALVARLRVSGGAKLDLAPLFPKAADRAEARIRVEACDLTSATRRSWSRNG